MFKSFEQNTRIFFSGLGLLFMLCLVMAFLNENLLLSLIPFGLLVALYFVPNIELPMHLLLFAVPLSFPLTRLLPIEMDFPDEALQLIVTAFMLFYFIKKRPVYKLNFLLHPITLLVIASFVWTMLAAIASDSVALSLKFVIKKVWYLIPFFFFAFGYFSDTRNLRIAFWLMFTSLTGIVLMVMYKAKGVGFSFTDVHDPIQPFFINHVMYGSMISCFFFVIIGAYYTSRKGSVYRSLLAISLLIYLVAIYFSYSRGAWGGVLFGIGMMVAIRLKLGKLVMPTIYTLLIIFVLWLSADNRYLQYRPNFDKTVMHEDLSDHLMATVQGTDISSAERYFRWIATVRMSRDYPIFGVGPNRFYDHYRAYSITEYRTWVSRNLEKSTTHNYFLFMLAEQGLAAMLLYAALIFLIFWKGQELYNLSANHQEKILILALLGLLGAVFVNNFFSELLETDKIGSLFYCGLALLVLADIRIRSRNING